MKAKSPLILGNDVVLRDYPWSHLTPFILRTASSFVGCRGQYRVQCGSTESLSMEWALFSWCCLVFVVGFPRKPLSVVGVVCKRLCCGSPIVVFTGDKWKSAQLFQTIILNSRTSSSRSRSGSNGKRYPEVSLEATSTLWSTLAQPTVRQRETQIKAQTRQIAEK